MRNQAPSDAGTYAGTAGAAKANQAIPEDISTVIGKYRL
jgi:hypothetical protein